MLQKEMRGRQILSAILLTVGWLSILISGFVYAFFWRVDNEPGASGTSLLWAAISFCSLGGLTFLGSHIYLIIQKAWLLILIAWVVCIVLLVGAVSLSPILLFFMV